MRAREHIHADGSSSFEFLSITIREFDALKRLEGEQLFAFIRANADHLEVVHLDPPAVPELDAEMVEVRVLSIP